MYRRPQAQRRGLLVYAAALCRNAVAVVGTTITTCWFSVLRRTMPTMFGILVLNFAGGSTLQQRQADHPQYTEIGQEAGPVRMFQRRDRGVKTIQKASTLSTAGRAP
ncbi:hypothetical protein BDV40DRAFT_294389 [Aspergillus tamarii]|uniref:Uncharacterized protein n=1 Tax=Aspergillus tamarii TaxID=41984 RepID=A0A5N6VBN1_ASPTM|nr:hypothetical protein BDV40DRAFT_294389 [Aspergillus tamarii]